ncbi:hypothetical protein Ddye_029438 [Dipteronia dyeriana]|uniref:Uncharacterized protein n=1 Tax=Dipteronia dyeriana TaxID=168575 RepID=A0AAD9TET4_9ROSI|nr:hypothetical protein Ddye_029438 [Dipteronia dyeriana]
MANNLTENTPVRLSSAVSIRQAQTNKIQNLVECTHIPESAQINETSLPLLNPYTVFKRSKSLSRRVTALVQHRSPPIKEYVQSTTLDNCLVPAFTDEQYVDLEIGQPLIDQWVKEGYSQLHIGAIRIVLTLHRRKGLPVTARIALLNTIYKEYEHAVIGTYLSTLHTGSISLTYYPNFNIPLRDQNLHNCLKVQLQVAGEPMMPNSYMATLHHQIAYRLQDHALDLPIPSHTGDTLFIKAKQVLNWHSRNARVQNRVLHSIDQKIDQVSHHVSQHDLHLQHLDTSLRSMFTYLQSRVARRDIDYHYRRMFFRYLSLGGINDESLRQDTTLGEIHMFTLTALDKLCATQRVFTKMIKEGRKYDKNYKLPDSYHLKCKSTDHCNCRPYRRSRRSVSFKTVYRDLFFNGDMADHENLKDMWCTGRSVWNRGLDNMDYNWFINCLDRTIRVWQCNLELNFEAVVEILVLERDVEVRVVRERDTTCMKCRQASSYNCILIFFIDGVEEGNAILAVTGSPFLPWRVGTILIAPMSVDAGIRQLSRAVDWTYYFIGGGRCLTKAVTLLEKDLLRLKTV